MTKAKLSIIVPCYNCSDTLQESVESCYSGGLSNFEILMVDDGSTDNTKEVMQMLADKHSEIKLFYHEQNKGGGAARNTGIYNANGKLIFCLDSDNILDSFSMQRMVNFLFEKEIDGVAFYERRFFHSQSKETYSSHYNKIINKYITIQNIFDASGTLLDNFLFTKESFLRTKGYPEHHGFDTQSFEMRYLSADNRVLVCPETIFYHRQNHNQPSYFEREFNKGNFSINCYFAIEDIWNLFSLQAKNEILVYDIFTNSNLENNLLSFLREIQSKGYLFSLRDEENNIHPFDNFVINYHKSEYEKAFDICKSVLKDGKDSKIIYFSLLRSAVGLSGKLSMPHIEKKVKILTEGMVVIPKTLNKWYHRNIITLKSIQLIQKVWKK